MERELRLLKIGAGAEALLHSVFVVSINQRKIQKLSMTMGIIIHGLNLRKKTQR